LIAGLDFSATPNVEGAPLIHHYFADETGDSTLFGSRGKVVIGAEGCSQFFMLGVARVVDPVGLQSALESLRAQLLADPYFRGVPSFDPTQKKTALCFHAKDDLPEVRREVFRVLGNFEVKVHAVVRDKGTVLKHLQEVQKSDPCHRYQPNDIYDDCVSVVFENLLHQADENHIFFARRGKVSRIASLGKALEQARVRYERCNGVGVEKVTRVKTAYPHEYAGLQAIDYCLWALQRKYERDEARFFEILRPKFEAIIEVEGAEE
jgi:hypothetical protein